MDRTAEHNAQILQDRVVDGMAFLDEHVPNWRESVKVEKLDMTDGEFCILGQVWHHNHEPIGDSAYYEAARRFSGHTDADLKFNWALSHGFVADDFRYTHQELTEAWQRALS